MNNLKDQLKFYFSLPNLANDKVLFLKLLYETEISPEFLLKFNKLKRILEQFENPSEVLLNLCKEIDELEVINNKIRLKHPISQEAVDEYRRLAVFKSIYFENIPDNSSIDLIIQVFQKYGKILYVSLPKWPETGILKGFGFLEFDQILSCEAAINSLNFTVPLEFKNIDLPIRILRKVEWLSYKERLQDLKDKLFVDDNDIEIKVSAKNLPLKITKTELNEVLLIKPWKIEYKQSSGQAYLIYANKLDADTVIRLQPPIFGHQVNYSYKQIKKFN